MTTQSEQTLENNLVAQLVEQGYERVIIADNDELLANLKCQLEKHNAEKLGDTPLSDAEFKRVVNHLDKGNVFDRAKLLRDKMHLVRDDGTSAYIEFINMAKWCHNEYQVAQQIVNDGEYSTRYDVTLLINGLPLVQIELKRRGIELKEAFNQINRYRRHSYASANGLFQYVQLFVISNGVDTKYYANSVSYGGTKKASFKQTFYWTDKANKRISQIDEFARDFLEKCHVSRMITKYIVLNETDKVLMVLRPYQYYAVERIIEKVDSGSNTGGYIWHTTGSGKTLTSFKAAQIMTENPAVDKVLFVVDRNDLDYQTIKEFNSFKEGSVDGTDNTQALVKQLSDPDTKLIVTTIQKLDNAIKRERHASAMESVRDNKIVFIFDECHRSQFGETHRNITEYFTNYQMFGFTGTPIKAENATFNSRFGKRTTADLFGACLHEYVITDAINDGNVLKFSVEYVGRFKQREDSKTNIDIDVEAIDTREAMEGDARVDKITDYIITNHDYKTHNRDFTAMMCVGSTDVLRKYYDAFAARSHNLKIATIFSYQANEEDKDADGMIDEVDIDMAGSAQINEHSRDVLERAMGDYNTMFGTNYTTRDSKSFYNYYKDIAKRVKSREIDILLVVNMFLTGFDSKTLNTLYVDKNLRYHGLLQAYSRTNRILNEVKSQGNIVVFRNLKKRTDEAVRLFSDKDASETIFLKSYETYVDEFDAQVTALLAYTPSLGDVDMLVGEEAKRHFVELFREVMRTRNVLLSFADFGYDDTAMTAQQFEDYKSKYLDLYFETKGDNAEKDSILNEVDFELELVRRDEINVDYILRLLARYVDADDTEKAKLHKQIDDLMSGDEKLRSKRELIEKFISGWLPDITDSEQVDVEFQKYWSAEEKRAIEQLASEEGLDTERLEKLIADYSYSGRKPRQDDYVRTLTQTPGIRERSSVIERIADKFTKFIRVFVDDV
ncbi:HsdR family type I site-specific deoxyribonuclease [Candidatus Mycosynbacter amalyticus]|uniref:Type I restriction enzyme endonuclease subunit n=1 Tax=Candidatus Mycosynbacter amalyticus TaxID=2665156 RepID=A0A857MLK4_9BACT|nr:type I restriction endonuclease subunit R [Candidatus Mycosynbacter amalyticus]QHN42675.1 HsdR family type I site-specific deoxyribonuclease [Candidatus Mycosynbacter amalyticus]